MSANTFRSLCAELVEELEDWIVCDDESEIADAHSLIDRARALLAQPEGEGPTTAELMSLSAVCNSPSVFARAVLARWGHPTPQPPADGEVEDLVKRLKSVKRNDNSIPSSVHWGLSDGTIHHHRIHVTSNHASDCDRAAELLQRFASPACLVVTPSPEAAATLLSAGPGRIELLPDGTQIIEPAEHTLLVPVLQPVPVAERLPGPEDCDAQGRCWLLTVEDEYPQWRLHSIEGAQPGGAMIWVPVDSSPGVMVDCFYTSHWLPAHALPLPTTKETSR